ncbi:MAG: LUD domain-containing protein [Veillonella sp.]|nr:LUD domain-containing protein [Veillonella sp.]
MANTETTINAVINPENNETPIDIEKTIKALERNKFVVHYFETGAEAISYLKGRIQNKRVAIGDSHTLLELKVHDVLAQVNDDTSVNALAQTGEMVNIDGTGNRVAASLFGSQEVFFVLGINKITPDLASAIYRARNVAAPLNSKKNKKSSLNPCARLEEKCYDCGSPDRICNALTIYYKKMRNMQTMEVIIINESLGF